MSSWAHQQLFGIWAKQLSSLPQGQPMQIFKFTVQNEALSFFKKKSKMKLASGNRFFFEVGNILGVNLLGREKIVEK